MPRDGANQLKKPWVTLIKLLLMAAILGMVGKYLYEAWHKTQTVALHIDWHYAPLGIVGFCGSMLTSGLVWRWIASRMGDHHPTMPLLGAYTFSQMGKYIPGKVVLLLMRIERAGRFGMDPRTCTLATLLENFIYLISGGLAGLAGLAVYWKELRAEGYLWVLPVCGMGVAALISATHPLIFYRLMDAALKQFKRPPVDDAHRLGMPSLVSCVLMFLPCWAFGGLAFWASARCVYPLPAGSVVVLMAGFALGVIIGMVSLLPGGALVREAMMGFFLVIELTHAGLDHDTAIRYASVAVVLQRLFQLVVEAGLGIAGGLITATGRKAVDSGTPELDVER
jgi:glycosyltransferase 2 family protein